MPSSSFEFQPPNPFSTQFVAPSKVTYRFATGKHSTDSHQVDAQLEELLAKVRGCRRALVVGPHGTGKSTLLNTFLPKLQRSFKRVVFHQLTNDPNLSWWTRLKEHWGASRRIRKELTQMPEGGLLLIDGWEQMTRWSQLRVTRASVSSKVSLLATSHKKHAGWTVIYETAASPQLVRALATDLMDDQSFETRKLVDQQLQRRSVGAKTNVRDLWFDMYDVVEDQGRKNK